MLSSKLPVGFVREQRHIRDKVGQRGGEVTCMLIAGGWKHWVRCFEYSERREDDACSQGLETAENDGSCTLPPTTHTQSIMHQA